jgi:hypothetical protein
MRLVLLFMTVRSYVGAVARALSPAALRVTVDGKKNRASRMVPTA